MVMRIMHMKLMNSFGNWLISFVTPVDRLPGTLKCIIHR